MDVALTFNVKPENNTFSQSLSSHLKASRMNSNKISVDTFAEWDTWETINAVKSALEVYHNVTLIEADLFAFEKLRDSNVDIVFNIAEGFLEVSREAQIPAILDMLNIPYSGSDPLTLSICLDKARTKEILSYNKIATPKFIITNSLDELNYINLKFPMMVKPNAEGSSKGIFTSSFVRDEEELKKEVSRIYNEYNQSVLVEEFLPGREFTVALIGNGSDVEVLPIVEINYKEFPEDFIPIYSYEAKWILDTKENPLDIYSCPAKISKSLEEKIKSICLKTYKVLNCRDWSRIDVRLDSKGEPNIIEVNPLPGILPDPNDNSCFPKAARTAGYTYEQMLNKVLYHAAKRNGLV